MDVTFRAVMFDMDGLMLDTERLYLHAWRMAAARLGYVADDGLLLSFVGLSVEECERRLSEAAGNGFSLDEFRTLWPQLWGEHVVQNGITVKPGLLTLLGWLAQRSVPRAVVTSTFAEDAAASLLTAGIDNWFEVVVSGDQVANTKPAPDIYLLAAHRLGVDPKQCVALEDSDAGILAASAAGMRAIMVPDLREPSREASVAAYRIVPSLVDALPLVQSLLQPQRPE